MAEEDKKFMETLNKMLFEVNEKLKEPNSNIAELEKTKAEIEDCIGSIRRMNETRLEFLQAYDELLKKKRNG